MVMSILIFAVIVRQQITNFRDFVQYSFSDTGTEVANRSPMASVLLNISSTIQQINKMQNPGWEKDCALVLCCEQPLDHVCLSIF